jgi:hypothetical protein
MSNITYLTIKEKIKASFESPLGAQLDELFSTSDNRIFIRYKKAKEWCHHLEDKSILHWFEEYNGQDPTPIIRNELLD